MGVADPGWPGVGRRAHVVAAPVVEAQAAAVQIVETARSRAAELLEEAEAQREGLFKAQREAALLEGLAEAQRVLVEVQRRATELLDSARTRAMVIELAVAIARRVLGAAWSAAPEQWARA